MIKSVNIIFGSLALFVVSGCTFSYNFNIVNLTNHAISIEYTFHDISKLGDIFNLNLQKAKCFNSHGQKQLPVYKNFNYTIDSTLNTVSSKLEKNEILHIGNVSGSANMSNINARKKIFAHVKYLKIISKDDTLSATTNFIHTLFLPTSGEFEYVFLFR